jgi:drug/metabolite transporter (DMT)-like permease
MSERRQPLVDARESRPLKGIFLTVVGIGCITFNDAMMKLIIDDHPIGEAIFVRGLFALVPIAFLVRRAGGIRSLKFHDTAVQFWCVLLLVGPLFLYIFSLRLLPLSIATIIFFTNPLFVTLLAPWFLDERVGWRRLTAVLVGFAGASLIVKPVGDAFSWIIVGPLIVALLSGVRELVVRAALARETSESLLFYSTMAVMLTGLATAPFGWVALSGTDLILLAAAGLGFGFGIYLMTDGLRYGDASLLSLYKYSGIIWALILGFLLWREVPDVWTLSGTGLIIASGLYIVYRQRHITA